jgi:hypothetical protein
VLERWVGFFDLSAVFESSINHLAKFGVFYQGQQDWTVNGAKNPHPVDLANYGAISLYDLFFWIGFFKGAIHMLN